MHVKFSLPTRMYPCILYQPLQSVGTIFDTLVFYYFPQCDGPMQVGNFNWRSWWPKSVRCERQMNNFRNGFPLFQFGKQTFLNYFWSGRFALHRSEYSDTHCSYRVFHLLRPCKRCDCLAHYIIIQMWSITFVIIFRHRTTNLNFISDKIKNSTMPASLRFSKYIVLILPECIAVNSFMFAVNYISMYNTSNVKLTLAIAFAYGDVSSRFRPLQHIDFCC